MNLTFTQGLNLYATATGTDAGDQTFLVPAVSNTKVQLNAPSSGRWIELAYAHRDTNYLLTIREDGLIDAWGYGSALNNNAPFTSGGGSEQGNNSFFLWIDIDRSTGLVSYGWSKYRPTAGASAPATNATRYNDQHWFDTSNVIMKVWNSTTQVWVEKVRCFVAQYTFGQGFTSMSDQAPNYKGTTVGLNGSYRAGALIFDVNGNPQKRTTSNNNTTFFTTEDIFATGLPTSSRTRLESFVVDGIAQQPIAAYQAVYYSDLYQLMPLQATDTISGQENVIFGIIEEAANSSGDLVKVTMDGVVNNSAWTWTAVNEQIYVDKNQPGVLVSVENDGYAPLPNQKPIAVAIDSTTILLRASELVLAVGGIDTFLELSDTPTSYGSSALLIPRVNAAESKLEFGAVLKNLTDVYDSLNPSVGHILYLSGVDSKWRSAVPGATSGVQPYNAHLTEISGLSAATNQFIVGSASTFVAKTVAEVKAILAISLSDLIDTDVSGGSPALGTGNLLRYNGTNWIGFDGDTAYIQDVFKTVIGDTGSVIAASTTDTLKVAGGSNITTTGTEGGSPINELRIDWTASLTDLSDVDLTGSPAPAEGDVLTKVGSRWLAQPIPTASVPTFELPRPYDFAAQSFAEVGSDSIMFKYVAPRDFILYSYGHQAQSRTRPPTVDRDFAITLDDGTTEQRIGTFRFYQSAISRAPAAFDMGLGTALTEGVPAGSPTHTPEPLWRVSRGDIIRIYTPSVGSPPSPITGFDDVSITLRGAVGPNVPVGTVSANFIGLSTGSPPYIGSPIGAIPSSLNLNVVGDYTYIEYSCVATSPDGSTWWPLDANEHSDTNRGIQLSEDGISYTTLNSESDYFTSALTDLHLQFLSIFPSRYYKVQATVFSVAGITTAQGIIYIPAF